MEKVACTATGVWLIQGKEYQVWKTRPHSFLWLCGISRSGKTILSSIILRTLFGGTPDHVGYFYFDFNDQRKRSLEDMLRSLLAQLYRKISTASQSLDKMCSSNLHGTQQPSLQQMQDTFKIIVSSLGDVFIVMDALDESSSPSEILAWLTGIRSAQYLGLRLLVTSRAEGDLEPAIRKWPVSSEVLVLPQQSINEDIHTYVDGRVQTEEFEKWRSQPGLQELVVAEFTVRANGM